MTVQALDHAGHAGHAGQAGQAGHADVYFELCPCRGLLDLVANKWSALEGGP